MALLTARLAKYFINYLASRMGAVIKKRIQKDASDVRMLVGHL